MRGPCHTIAPYGIFGAGGHGREVAWLATQCGIPSDRLRFVVDPEFARATIVNGIPVVSTEEFTRLHPGAPVFVAIGDPHQRQKNVARLRAVGHHFPPLVSCHAILSPSVRYGEGALVFPGVTMTVNIRLREHVHVNVNCSISHDVAVGAFTSISPGVTVCGRVRVGNAVFIGAAACVINGVHGSPLVVGDDAVIAAGACVVCSVCAGAKVGGVPARPLRRRTVD
jgi:sugar O-acyltransferase (sialic acid O-acetyltransferase NeuD family)